MFFSFMFAPLRSSSPARRRSRQARERTAPATIEVRGPDGAIVRAWFWFGSRDGAQADRLRRGHVRQADAARPRPDGDAARARRRGFCGPFEETRRAGRFE